MLHPNLYPFQPFYAPLTGLNFFLKPYIKSSAKLNLTKTNSHQ